MDQEVVSTDRTHLSAQHWNNNQVCAVTITTTGPDPVIHEMIQLAVLPLDSFLMIRKDVIPFYVNIKSDYPHLLKTSGATRVGAKMEIMERGFESEDVKDIFFNKWIPKLQLGATKWGTPKQIYPLGHNYAETRMFLQRFFGCENYLEVFGDRYLDPMVTALYLNDRASFHGEMVPFSKVDLRWLAKQYTLDVAGYPDALIAAKVSAEVYRYMCKRGMF